MESIQFKCICPVHRVINAFEESGFLLKDTLAWKKPSAHHRAQRVSIVFERRGLVEDAKKWEGWRLGNLAPIWEPIAWFMKPYTIGGTITDNILENEVGAMNIEACKLNGSCPTNMLEFGFDKNETRIHEAQKPLALIEYLIKLTTQENHLVLDPFMGSGTTAVAAKRLSRNFIGFEANPEFHSRSLERIAELSPDNIAGLLSSDKILTKYVSFHKAIQSISEYAGYKGEKIWRLFNMNL
ncbi:MAG: site-specific DNA-methyltransferase, partial [Desulfamplus sp.]